MSSQSGHPSAKSEQSSKASGESGHHATRSGPLPTHAPEPTHRSTRAAPSAPHPVELEQHATHPQEKICGGVGGARPVNDEDMKIWDMYKTHLEKKIREKFHVPTTHKLKPVQVSTQVVAGMNYFFKVELPDKKYATARVYHVPWQTDTHGKAEQVDVHDKLLDNPNENVGHF